MKMQSRNGSRCFALGALALATILSVGRAQARDLIEITTPYFTVVSALNEKDTRELIEEMRIFQVVVTKFTTVKDLRPQVPLRLYLINASDWEKYLQPKKNVAGVMWARPLGFDGAMNAHVRMGATRLLFHEYTHFVARNAATGSYPQWFDEGLAEVLSTVKIVKGKVQIGEPPGERLKSLADVGGASWVPLAQLLQAKPNRVDDDNPGEHGAIGGFYAESWALVHYLIFEHPSGSRALNQYLAMHQENVSIDEAFTKAFGMSVTEMEVILKRYVQRRAYKTLTADPDTLQLPSDGPYTVRQLNGLESAQELGQLIVRLGGRLDSSIEYFDRVLKSEPKFAPALAGKANILEQRQQPEAADVAIKQALEWAPEDRAVLHAAANIHFLRFVRLARPNADPQLRMLAARTAFDYYDRVAAIPSAGSDALEVAQRYAQLALQTRADLNRPLERIASAREKYPNEPRIAATHAQLLTVMNRAAEARPAWEVAARYGQGQVRDAALRALGAKP